MDELFKSLREFFVGKETIITNPVFRLHYKITTCLLFGFAIFCTSSAYLGKPIFCMSKDDIPEDLLSTYCWIHTTFSVENAWHQEVGEDVVYPGVGQHIKGETKVYHSYYQWVGFVLLFQGALFYVGKYFWSSAEDNKVKHLQLELDNPVLEESARKNQLEVLKSYLTENFNKHQFYYFSYALAEIINLINVIGQMFLMDRFLGGYFSTYGSDVLAFTEWDWSIRYDPMIRVFPRVAKCTFHRFGPSGDVQKHDTLCILPLNIVNEKIYVFLWFWFIILSTLSALSVLYRIVAFFVPRVRAIVLRSKCLLSDRDQVDEVINRIAVGDWMLLNNLAKNMDGRSFGELMSSLAFDFDPSSSKKI